MLQASEFWNYSLNLYEQPGIKSTCLMLQDKFKLNVNLLMLCCYLNRLNNKLPVEGFNALTEAIEDTDLQLQAMRRKRRNSRGTPLYRELLQQELQIEKQQQQSLVEQVNQQELEQRSTDNLLCYLDSQYPRPPEPLIEHLSQLRQIASAGETRQENNESDGPLYE